MAGLVDRALDILDRLREPPPGERKTSLMVTPKARPLGVPMGGGPGVLSPFGGASPRYAGGKIPSATVDDPGQLVGANYSGASSWHAFQERPYAAMVAAYRSWVYTCIDKIAKSVAMIPLRLYVYRRDGRKLPDPWTIKREVKSLYRTPAEQSVALKEMGVKKVPIAEHPFIDLMQRPNGIMTRMQLWYETLIRMELAGQCGWLMLKNRLGLPGEIWPLPLTRTATLWPRVGADARVECWNYLDGQVNRVIAPEDMLFFHYSHPASPWQGMSPLIAQDYPYDIDLFLMQQQRALYENQAVPGMTLSTDQRLTRPQVEEFLQLINERYSGPSRAGKTMVLHSGMKPDRIGLTGREIMIKDAAAFAREKIVTSYDLSEGKVGMVRDVNRANAEALNETFLQECLRPKCMLVEEVIEAFMLPMYDEGLMVDFELPDYGDKSLRMAERGQNLNTYYSTINEERAKDGLSPVPWGDAPWMGMVQQWTPEGLPQQQQPPPGGGGGGGNPFEDMAPPDDLTEDEKVLWLKIKAKRRWWKGGPGSGNFGHAGRPGEVGGSSSEGGGGEGGSEEIVEVHDRDTGGTYRGFKDSDGFVRNYDPVTVYWGHTVSPKEFTGFRGGDKEGNDASSSGTNDYVTPDLDTARGYAETHAEATGKLARVYSFELRKGEAWLPYSGPHKTDGFELATDISKERVKPFAVMMNNGEWVEHRSHKGGPGSGNFGHGGRPGERGGSGPGSSESEDEASSARAQRVRESYKPATRDVQRRGLANQGRLAQHLKGVETQDNAPFDVVVGRHAIEIKTIVRGVNDKITMHPDSLRRKVAEASAKSLKPHTVVFDDRSGKVYHAPGVGSFRLNAMRETSLDELRTMFK